METLILAIQRLLAPRGLNEEGRPLVEGKGFLTLLERSQTTWGGEIAEEKGTSWEGLPLLVLGLPSIMEAPEAAPLRGAEILSNGPSKETAIVVPLVPKEDASPILRRRGPSPSTCGQQVEAHPTPGPMCVSLGDALPHGLSRGDSPFPLSVKPEEASTFSPGNHRAMADSPSAGEKAEIFLSPIPVPRPTPTVPHFEASERLPSLLISPSGASGGPPSKPIEMLCTGTLPLGNSACWAGIDETRFDLRENSLHQPPTGSPPIPKEPKHSLLAPTRDSTAPSPPHPDSKHGRGSPPLSSLREVFPSRFALIAEAPASEREEGFSEELLKPEVKEGLPIPDGGKGRLHQVFISSSDPSGADPLSMDLPPRSQKATPLETFSPSENGGPSLSEEGNFPRTTMRGIKEPEGIGPKPLSAMPSRSPQSSSAGEREAKAPKAIPETAPSPEEGTSAPSQVHPIPTGAFPEQGSRDLSDENRIALREEKNRTPGKNEGTALLGAVNGVHRGDQPAETGELFDRATPRGLTLPPGGGQAREICEQVAARLISVTTGKGEKVRFRLDPPSLGFIDVEIRRERDGIKATLWADHSVTKELLERHFFELRAMLESDGLRLEQFDVFLKQGWGSFQERHEGPVNRQPWQERNDQEKAPEGRILWEGGPRENGLERGRGIRALDVMV